MINVWILTVVVSKSYSLTSFQVKFYNELDAKISAESHVDNIPDDYHVTISITKTQEQKYEH